jgi:N-acetylmuramoyl-L-alanine amidase
MTGSGGRVETVTTVRFAPRGAPEGEYVSAQEIARILRGTATWDGAARMLTISGDGKKAILLVGGDRFVVSKPNAAQVAGRLRSGPVRHRGATWLEKAAAQSFLRQFHAAAFRSLPAALIGGLPIPLKPVPQSETRVASSPSATTAVSAVPPISGRPIGARPETGAPSTGSTAGVAASPAAAASAPESGRRVAPFIRNIVIDAGHGDHDAGAIGPNGVREKDVNLDVALKLSAALGPRVGGRLTLTRRDDTFLSLKDRVAVAKRVRADLFISVHSNSVGGANRHRASGTEVYFFSTPSDDDARLAERLEGGPFDPNAEGIDPVLWDLMLAGNVVESHKLAEMVSKVLPGAVGLPNRGVKSARFYVMYYGVMSNFPSILVELGYLSNPTEEAKLGNPEWREKAANAIADAVVSYLVDLERRYPGGRGWSR